METNQLEGNSTKYAAVYLYVYVYRRLVSSTAAWLAQLVERQSAVREVEGSSPRLDQHSGS